MFGLLGEFALDCGKNYYFLKKETEEDPEINLSDQNSKFCPFGTVHNNIL